MDNIHAMGTRSGKPLISADIRTSFLIWSCLLLLLGQSFQGHAQIFPVQSSTQLVPPYSVYLSDYVTPGNEKLRVILVQRDLTQPSYQLRLLMQVEWNGKVIMRTSRAYNPAPISLDPGVPTIISGAELFPYLDSRNIDFVGYSREQYERTKALPEGSYRISFTAYDYRRQDVQVSNEGSSFYYLSKNEPPLINMPVCGAKVPVREPQQVIFSWLPRNTSSPASAGGTQYEFSLYEIRPEGRNPNDVVLSSQPVFKTTIDYTQLVYGPAEPQLVENMRYAWRVRAIDTQGRDAFRNNGYSEVCTFTYGGVDPAFIVGGIEGLQAEGESERSARIWWEQGNFDSYRIYYKKSGEGYEWFTSDLLAKDLDPAKEEGELKLFDLEPDTEYETRAQAKKMGNLGPYTDIVKFRTLPVRVAHCGDPALLPEGGPGEPFREAIKGMTIDVDGMEMTLLDVVHLGDGYYQGLGRVSVDYLGGAAFTASFDRIFINTDRQVVLGRIDFVTRGVGAMAEEQLARQEKRKGEKEAEDLAVNGNGNEGKDIIFKGIVDSVFVDEKGEIIIIDTEGERFVYGQQVDPATGVVLPVGIVDGGGNGYVVDNEGRVNKVEGGGLGGGNTPDGTTETDSILFVQKELIKEVLQHYKEEINLWLENNDKGPLEEALIRRLMAMPDCLPEDEEELEAILERLEYFEENPEELIELITANTENQDRFDFLVNKLNGEQPPYREGLTETEWDELLTMVCPHLLPEGKSVLIEGLSENAALVSINTVASSFKPDEERLDLTYTVKDTLNLFNSKLEIFKLNENDEELVTFYSNLEKGKQIEFIDSQDDNKKGWSGKGSDGEFIMAGQYKVKLTATTDESFSKGYEDYEQFEVLTASDEIYDYFVTDNDAWYREKEAPYKAITPEPRTNILVKTTQVAVLEVIQDGKGKDVAKVRLKNNRGIEYTSFSNLTQVKSFPKERKYRFLEEYTALTIPFSGNTTDKIYNKDAEIMADKYFGNYLKVKGYDYWVEKSVAIWIDEISTATIVAEFQNATKVGSKYTSNETSVACNICVRSALLLLKEDQVLFPLEGSAYYDPADGFKVSYIKGSITNPGRAKNIKEDFDVISSKLDLNARFTEIEKHADEGWEAYFKRLQDKADAGGIIVGAMLNSSGSSGHVMMITPGGLINIDLDDPNEHVSKWGESYTSRNILKVPRVLECGTGVREDAAPLCRNVDRRGAQERLKWFIYNN